MGPSEFKERFRQALGEIPEELDLEVGIFRPFPQREVESLDCLSDAEKSMLVHAGLPEDAAPFLNFNLEMDEQFVPLSKVCDLGPEFARYLAIGRNGYGDYLSLDARDGNVVYHNHDLHMERVFINSSIAQFAETLCLFAENKDEVDFLKRLQIVDPVATETGAMWPLEASQRQEAFDEDAVPDASSPPDPVAEEEDQRTDDEQFLETMGPESDTRHCLHEGCDRGAIELSVLCQRHHFERIKGRPWPFGG